MIVSRAARLTFAGLLIVLILGAALRARHIGTQSLWLDEAASWQLAQESLGGIVEDTTIDVHPPLYYFALHYWMRIAGQSESALRSLSAVFGVLLIAAVYRLASRLFDPITGLVAAFLVALSTFHISLAQEARMYALLTLCSVVSMDGFVRLIHRDRPARWAVAEYVVATTAMLYTQNYGWFIFVAQMLCLFGLLVASREAYLRVWRRTLLAQAVVVLLYLPWLERFFEQMLHVQQGFWIPAKPALSLLKTFVEYAGSTQLAWLLMPLAIIAVVLGRRRRETAVLVVWLGSLVVLPFVISMVSAPIFLPKYTIAGSVAVLVLAARGVTLIPRRALQTVVVLAVAWLSVAPLTAYYGTATKQRWRDLVARVDQQAKPGDLVLFNQAYLQAPFDFYIRRTDLVEVPFLEFREGLTSRSVKTLVRLAAAGHDRVWLVLTITDPLTPLILDELGGRYAVSEHLEDRDLAFYLLRTTSSN